MSIAATRSLSDRLRSETERTAFRPAGLVDRLGSDRSTLESLAVVSGASELCGRESECLVLDRLVTGVRSGQSQVLVLRGDAGIGKTALLGYLSTHAAGCRITRVSGVEAEREIPYAGLHQLCAPMLSRLDRLPTPQHDALATAFGLTVGDAPDPFLVGLAVLSLIADGAEERPLICLVDDVQWLDGVSLQTLAFVARRLLAESIGLVFAGRATAAEDDPRSLAELSQLPQLPIRGLNAGAARSLLEAALQAPLDEAVRNRIVSETGGNPLALLELPRAMTAAELAGGFGLADTMPLTNRIEEGFIRRLVPLPAEARRLLLAAAVEPVGDAALLWRAIERLGIEAEAAGPAQASGLIEIGSHVRFRHPLVRSAVCRAADPRDLQETHRALAEVTDAKLDPDRRAWHRARAAAGPDESVAAELEQSAGRAQARGGIAAAAAFLERATELTVDPEQRGHRALAAAQAKHQAGAPDSALRLLAVATDGGRLDELQSALANLLRAQIAFTSSHGREGPPLLLEAAKRLEPLDNGLARATYLDAFTAALFVGRLSDGVGEVARAVRLSARPSTPHRAPDLLLDGLALLSTEGYAAATPTLREALVAFRGGGLSTEEGLRWLWLAGRVAMALWDDETWHVLADRHVALARDTGALSVLPIALRSRTLVHVYAGELGEGGALLEEAQAVADATGSQLGLYGNISLAAWQGREAEVVQLVNATMEAVSKRGEGMAVTSQFTASLLYNGFGRYESAFAAAEQACDYDDLGVAGWALTELVEAAVRTGRPARASEALERLSEMTEATGGDWALGIEARSRAQLSEGEVAECLYLEGIDRLGRTRIRPALARAHLLYGEWLRREGRRVDARQELRIAYGLFEAMDINGFAERARRELSATGETARKRTDDTRADLTAQEAQIARLALDGLTNPEIGAQLFISPRTVEWHLRKVYPKLGIASRKELRNALSVVA